jgi:hypothetical protein
MSTQARVPVLSGQARRPAGHTIEQVPVMQAIPVGHSKPHAPQLCESFRIDAQPVLQRIWSDAQA